MYNQISGESKLTKIITTGPFPNLILSASKLFSHEGPLHFYSWELNLEYVLVLNASFPLSHTHTSLYQLNKNIKNHLEVSLFRRQEKSSNLSSLFQSKIISFETA